MDFEKARFNMVEQQIRPWDVLDQRILDLLLQLPREDFVLPEQQKIAFADLELPLANGSFMLTPKLEARLIQEIHVQNSDKVLEIGTGNAYMTAILAGLAKHVYSIDLDEDMIEAAKSKLAKVNMRNVSLKVGDGLAGMPEEAPFDKIICGGAVATIPQVLKESLNIGGRLIAIVGQAPLMKATLVVRETEQAWREIVVFETCAAHLQAGESKKAFVF